MRKHHKFAITLHAAVMLTAWPTLAQAVRVCDIDGQSVNPANGHTTAGKTGVMRCRESEGGPLVREQEIRNGVFIGLVRHYKDGVLLKEHSVNERGNRDGLAREFAGTPGASNPLVREETLRNSQVVGLARTWHPSGQLRRVAFHGDDGREQAVAGFTPEGRLGELRCGAKAVLAPAFDDAAACGHNGAAPTTVALHRDNGAVQARVTHENGERRKSETLWDNGRVREQLEITADGGAERRFSAEGVKRREVQWVRPAQGNRAGRITTLEQEFHESGTLLRERRWRVTAQGSELAIEQDWYLNGQPRDKQEYLQVEGQPARRGTSYHDTGRVASEGLWLIKGRYDASPIGAHRVFDEAGRLRREQHHDARGRLNRERVLDEAGAVVRDDELFEDGSRKAVGR